MTKYIIYILFFYCLLSCNENSDKGKEFIDTAVNVIDTTLLKDPSDTLEKTDTSPVRDIEKTIDH